jgi:hypothetical protein
MVLYRTVFENLHSFLFNAAGTEEEGVETPQFLRKKGVVSDWASLSIFRGASHLLKW